MTTQPKCCFCGDAEVIDLELEFERLDLSAQHFYLECNINLEAVCYDCFQSSFQIQNY